MTKAKDILIDKITVDLSIIGRERLNEDAVELYKGLMEGGWKKPVILQKGSLRLVDGAHRIEAAEQLGRNKIFAEERDIKDSDLRIEAYRYNQKHGVQYTKEERNKIIVNLYTKDSKTQQEIADVFGLSQRHVSEILGIEENTSNRENSNSSKSSKSNKNTKADKRRVLTKDEERTVALLAIKGEKQEDLATKFGTTQQRVSQLMTDYKAELRERYADGDGRMNIADAIGLNPSKLDEILISATDKDPLDFELPIITWWDSYGLDKRQKKIPGAVPVHLVKNLLALHTNPGDHVLDLFAGGGVTKIACDDMIGRSYELFDLSPDNEEIKQFSIIDDDANVSLPSVERKPDFLFLDPPYGSQKKGEYTKDKRDLSNLEIADYITVLKMFFKLIKDEWAPIKVALLMSSQRKKNMIYDLPSIFSEGFRSEGYTTIDHIVNQVNRPQSSNAPVIESARKHRWLMREHIHILVVEV